ncbi:MAG: magnesium transporter [Oscillospiraceae bacterium]|nr:magnesium transporter [Oscillospiraceae bacterium]
MQNLLTLLNSRKFIQVRRIIQEMNSVDLAELISEIEDEKDTVLLFRLLPKEMAAEVFSYLEHDQQQRVVEGLTDKELAGILDDLFMDDTVDFIDEMPASIVKRVIKIADPDTRRQINQLLMYPDSSAGSLMTTEFMEVDRDWEVGRAIREIRRQCEDKESLSQLFVTDEFRHLEGTVALRDLLAAKDSEIIGDLMESDVKSVKTHDHQEDVADLFKKYDLVSMPVVDNENRLVGLITIDDVVDVMEEETTEDIYKMAAMEPTEESYADAGVFAIARKRIPWLLILMISATFSGIIMQNYNSVLSAHVILASFVPMLMDTSGNAGSQTSVSVIRSLVLGEVECRDIFRVLWKELRIGMMVGTGMGVLNFIRIVIQYRDVGLASVVGITLFCAVIAANLVGGALPIAATKFKLDPALMASPMITTIVDAMSLTVFFNVAIHILPGLK